MVCYNVRRQFDKNLRGSTILEDASCAQGTDFCLEISLKPWKVVLQTLEHHSFEQNNNGMGHLEIMKMLSHRDFCQDKKYNVSWFR